MDVGIWRPLARGQRKPGSRQPVNINRRPGDRWQKPGRRYGVYGRKLFAVYCILLTLLLSVSLSSAGVPDTASEKGDAGVIIMPFAIHSRDNLSNLRRQFLNKLAASIEADSGYRIAGIERLKKLVLEEKVDVFDEAMAAGIGRDEGAAFAVLGSITKIGNNISIDVRLVDVNNDRLAGFFNVKGQSDLELLESAVSLALNLKGIMAKVVSRASAGKPGIISSIAVTGNKRVDEDAVKAKIKSKAGDAFFPDDIKDDIKAIYDMGYFEDVMADVADTAGGIELTFIVKERPVVKKVEITGNDEITTEKINGIITVKGNSILNCYNAVYFFSCNLIIAGYLHLFYNRPLLYYKGQLYASICISDICHYIFKITHVVYCLYIVLYVIREKGIPCPAFNLGLYSIFINPLIAGNCYTADYTRLPGGSPADGLCHYAFKVKGKADCGFQ